ncbi:MAG: integrin alpha [Phycisphaerae bacterium]
MRSAAWLRVAVGLWVASAAAAQTISVPSPNEQAAGFFARALAALDDVTGDNRGDMLVGAPNEQAGSGADYAGRAYILSASTDRCS